MNIKFLKPITFIKKYENKRVNIEVSYNKEKCCYKIHLSCNNYYTIINSNKPFNSDDYFDTFCLFIEKEKIVACYVGLNGILYINRDKNPYIIEVLIQRGVPLLWME